MNILFFTENAFALSETFIYNQIKNPNIKPFIVCHELKNREVYDFNSDAVHQVSWVPTTIFDRLLSMIYRFFLGTGKYSFPLSSIKRINKLVKDCRIDIIHCNYGHNAIKFLPVIKKNKTPLICHFHGFDASNMLKDKDYVRKLKKLLSRSEVSVMTVSEDMTKRLSQAGIMSAASKCVPYGIDIKKIQSIGNRRFNATNSIKITHAGRLVEKKGVVDLVKVFAVVQKQLAMYDLSLMIIGDGPEKDRIMEKISEPGLDSSVTMTGAASHNQLLEYLYRTDIFVLNSRIAAGGDMEGFPNTVMEAMSTGCAVVSTYHAGIPEAIDHDITGILIEEKNNEELACALIKLITDRDYRFKLQKNAMNKSMDSFSVDLMHERYNMFYQEILNYGVLA
jgi:glycosyltransferase involved in cell wall biosynthesis